MKPCVVVFIFLINWYITVVAMEGLTYVYMTLEIWNSRKLSV